jgi:tetratricopeptide (TPR) repeat protein
LVGARVGLYQIAILTGDAALADQQVSAVAGRRDEVDMVAIRMFAATYHGRMKEAADLAADFQARALALSRPRAAGSGILQLAISEALFGLTDRAKARVDKAEEDGILAANTADDRMVVAAIAKDGAMARQLMAAALEEVQKFGGDDAARAEFERAIKALVALAEGKAAEAAALIEPVSFDASHTDVVNIWTIAKVQTGDWPAAVKGLTFINSREGRGGLSATTAYVYATLARVQVKMGQPDEARRNYQKFLELLKDADPDLPLLVEVKDEIAKLGS